MITTTQITGIILAGGKSRRMGSDKGLIMYKGWQLVKYSIELLKPYCTRILISTNNSEYEQFGYELIGDEITGAGPMAGIASCLRKSNTELNIVLSCDMPLLEPVIIETLLKNSKGNHFVVPVDNEGRAEPLCAVYTSGSLKILDQCLLLKSFRMTELFNFGEVRYISPQDYTVKYRKEWFANFNTLDDLMISDNNEK